MQRILVAAFLLAAVPAFAQTPSGMCVEAAKLKDTVTKDGTTWVQVTPDQWEFLRGTFVMNPRTPPGLPFGDRAVLVHGGGQSIVLFLDGDKACEPMPIPDELVKVLTDVGTGEINHEGNGS